MNSDAEFDQYADDYDDALARSISVSGEDKEFFARGRIEWLARGVRKTLGTPGTVMDFGSGTGSAAPFLLNVLGAKSVIGVDVSPRLQALATKNYGGDRVRFLLFDEHQQNEPADLVFSNGTFHHIRPIERAAAVNYIHRSLMPGGLFALWENNPWNPATRYVMNRCPFDKNACYLSPIEARRLVQTAGFEVLSTEFLFIFPRALRWFRPVEPLISRLPLGAQYQVLCRKQG